MYRIPYSYEQEIKEQVEERLAAIERFHRADVMDRARCGARHNLASQVGAVLIRLSVLLARSDKVLDQVGS